MCPDFFFFILRDVYSSLTHFMEEPRPRQVRFFDNRLLSSIFSRGAAIL
jgi:hypothetical protein